MKSLGKMQFGVVQAGDCFVRDFDLQEKAVNYPVGFGRGQVFRHESSLGRLTVARKLPKFYGKTKKGPIPLEHRAARRDTRKPICRRQQPR